MNPRDITVYDPAMCCSTGVCGLEVDPELVRFSADLAWLAAEGVTVRRFNLAQEPGAFVEDADAKGALERKGESALPLIKAGGAVVSSGTYPSRDELANWAGFASAPSLSTEAVAELVAIGAAIASNCEPCFKFHHDKARKLGVPREDMLRAVTTARSVKDRSARAMLELAQRTFGREAEAYNGAAPAAKSDCCGPVTADVPQPEETPATKGGCCGPAAAPAAPPKRSRAAAEGE